MVVIGFGLFAGTALWLRAQTTPAPSPKDPPSISTDKPMSFWMKSKLNASKSALEALAKGDFATLEKDAEHMRLIGRLEGFVRRQNPDYKAHLHTFDLANQELVRQAKRNNAEGAALAFNQLTNSCVACHVMLREGIE
jgi:cytochrome c556